MKNVDYSNIFLRYERDPFRQKGIEESLMKAISRDYPKKKIYRIIDIGCGTGNWLHVNFMNLANYKNIEWFGIDNSKEMLTLAKEKNHTIHFVLATASLLPFHDNSFNFVINEFTYHHFVKKRKSFSEIYRIMSKNGILRIRNIEPWRMSSWSLYYFFPTTRELDKKRFLRVEKLETILNNLGFKDIKIDFNTIIGNEYKTIEKWFEIMNNKTHSQFHIINDKEYAKGMEQIEDLLINNKNELKKILDNNITTIVEINAVK